jgi:hypothetical protein
LSKRRQKQKARLDKCIKSLSLRSFSDEEQALWGCFKPFFSLLRVNRRVKEKTRLKWL